MPEPPTPSDHSARTPSAGGPVRMTVVDPPMLPFAVGGTALWAVAFLVLLPFHGWLSRHGHTDWLWTCVAGVIGGLVGTYVMIRHDRNRAARRAAAQDRANPPD